MISPLDHFILHLSLIPGVGIETIKMLTKNLEESFIDIVYTFTPQGLQNHFGLSEKKAVVVYNGLQNATMLEKERELIEKNNCFIISFLNEDYPDLLSTIDSPPPILYYKGAPFPSYKNTIKLAIVGSRKANYYAKQVINQFVPEFVKNNICVVSGGALGVDTMAHEATLQNNGKTMVILGSGFSKIYPYQNKKLFENIIEKGGTVITPFSIETEPLAHNFPERNRIISGLSKAVLIVQAAEKSGAYITAKFALDQGREVCVVPGSIFDPLSVGCHNLIKEGAILADFPITVLEACSVYAKASSYAKATADETPDKSSVENHEKEENDYSLEAKIIKQCIIPVFFDELLDVFDTIESSTLQNTLCLLQIQGKIKQDVSGAFFAVT